MLVTLRDVPVDAEITSHQLLARGGYIKRLSSGIYAYMPLMWRVIKKITAIVQEEMDAAGALQTLLPQLHPSDLWKKSGRWNSYTAGEGLMFNLQDRQGRELGLGPTHEEVATKIIGEQIRSYKQLPINIYQIQTKFRDEIRPRFGLMRGREFIMKDAYSFHANKLDLEKTYKEMNTVYKKIFTRCGIQTVQVDADSGSIGGGASQEFMVTADAGEDLILQSSDGLYAANEEKAISKAKRPSILESNKSVIVETKNQNTIEKLCISNKLDPSQIIKVILIVAILESGIEHPVLISIRGDQEVNEIKLINEINNIKQKKVLQIKFITKEDFISQGIDPIPFGYIGPDLDDSILEGSKTWENSFIRIIDLTAAEIDVFVCGANKENKHVFFSSWEKVNNYGIKLDIRKAKSGDRCIHNEAQTLTESRGIEVGHVFQLGRKYSESMGIKFTNEKGEQEGFWMGCYGIGISRLAQAAVEQYHDENGIIWPISIAPFEVIISIANIKDQTQKELGEGIYNELTSAKIETLLDDRDERAGVKFKDADLIGIPWRIVIGRDASNQIVELIERSNNEKKSLKKEIVIKKLLTEISGKNRSTVL